MDRDDCRKTIDGKWTKKNYFKEGRIFHYQTAIHLKRDVENNEKNGMYVLEYEGRIAINKQGFKEIQGPFDSVEAAKAVLVMLQSLSG